MDPVSVIVAALTAGAVAGAQNTATEAVKDAYAGLKALVTRRFADPKSGETVLEQHAGRPERYEQVLQAELVDVDAGADEQVLAAARRLLELIDRDGVRAGRYVVDARGSQGIQVGDHNTMNSTFTSPPAPPT